MAKRFSISYSKPLALIITIPCSILTTVATASVTAGMDSKVITWDLWLDPDRGKRVPKKVR